MAELVVGAAQPSHCLNLGRMRDALDADYAALDLEDDDKDILLNEGLRVLVSRSEWLRAAVALPLIVSGSYGLADNIERIRSIRSDSHPLDQVTPMIGLELLAGDATSCGLPVWWRSLDDQGVETVTIFPNPDDAASVLADVNLYPPELYDPEDEPAVPCEYRRAIVSYAVATALGLAEDDRDLSDANMADFELAVTRLRTHRIRRFGSGPVQMRLAGQTA